MQAFYGRCLTFIQIIHEPEALAGAFQTALQIGCRPAGHLGQGLGRGPMISHVGGPHIQGVQAIADRQFIEALIVDRAPQDKTRVV